MNIRYVNGLFNYEEGVSLKSQAVFFIFALYVLLCPFVFFPNIVGGLTIPASDLLLPLPFIFFLYVPSLKYSFTGICVILFVFLSFFLVLFNAGDSGRWGSNLFQVVRLIGIFTPLLMLFSRERITSSQFINLTRLAWLGSLIAVIAGIVLHLLGIQMRTGQQELWGSGIGSILRAGGLTGNTAEYGHIAAIWISLTLLFSKSIFGRYRYAGICLGLLIYAYVVIISSSRGSIVDVIAMTSFYAIASASGNIRKQFSSFVLIFGIIAIYVLALWLLKGRSNFIDLSLARIDFFNIFYDNDAVSETRLNNLSFIVENYRLSDAVGIGYKSTAYVYGRLFDNTFITCLVEQGILGLILYIGIVVGLFWAVSKRVAANGVAVKINAMLFGFVAHSLTFDVHTIWATTPAFLAFIAAFLQTYQPGKMPRSRSRNLSRQRRSQPSIQAP